MGMQRRPGLVQLNESTTHTEGLGRDPYGESPILYIDPIL